jgi:hypothetical protein
VQLFEVGHVFLRSARAPDEPLFVAGVLCGERAAWLSRRRPLDFYDRQRRRRAAARRAALARELRAPRALEEGFLHPASPRRSVWRDVTSASSARCTRRRATKLGIGARASRSS